MHIIESADLLCPCCHTGFPDARLIAGLNHLQALIGRELAVASGFRCPKHNAESGGALFSQHLTGRAADISAPGLSPLHLYLAAEQIPLFQRGGIGLYPLEYIHVDTREARARWFHYQGQDRAITDFLTFSPTS